MNLIFENSGELDLRCLTTFGCSVKETDNPIGFFGTGLKYALAVLLRTGHRVTIQSGTTSFPISILKSDIRGKEFGLVQVGNQAAGFTTELGKLWEVWMAYRELYCNAKDEQDWSVAESAHVPKPAAGKTRLIISGDAIVSAHRNRIDFILEGSPDLVLGDIEVFNRPTKYFFYKGIRVAALQTPALFTYNQKSHLELTEDRTVKDPYAIRFNVSRAVLKHAEEPMLRKLLVADPMSTFEGTLDYHGWSGCPPGRDFYCTVEKLQRDNATKVNPSALRLWREKGNGYLNPRRIQPTSVQSAIVEKAIAFCEKIGFPLRGEFPIIAVETLGGTSVLAVADTIGKTIYLTSALLDMGTKQVAAALIEEYLHLKYGFADESRQMQTYLFNKIVSIGEELNGEPL